MVVLEVEINNLFLAFAIEFERVVMKERMQAAKVHEVHELAKKSSKREQFLISLYLF